MDRGLHSFAALRICGRTRAPTAPHSSKGGLSGNPACIPYLTAPKGHALFKFSIVPLNTFTSMSGRVPGTEKGQASGAEGLQFISLLNCQSVYVLKVPVGKSVTLPVNRAYHRATLENTSSFPN